MKTFAMIAGGLFSLALSPAYAAPPPHLAASLSQTIGALVGPLESIKFPVVGTVGNISLNAFPALTPKLPLLGKGLPLVSSLTVHDSVIILQSVSILQKPLPGLGAVDSLLAGAGKH